MAEMKLLLEEARDLLMERKHGNPARSPGHNARLVIEEAIKSLAASPQAPAREGVVESDAAMAERLYVQAWAKAGKTPRIAWSDLSDGPDDGKTLRPCRSVEYRALYTHPSPDETAEKLRAAVEALEPFANLAPGTVSAGVNMSDPLSKWFTIANLVAAAQALAALSPKEEGGE